MDTNSEQEVVTLPTDRKRSPVSSYFRAKVSTTIAPDIYSGPSPVNVALLVALNAALYRHTGNTDLTIGFVLEAPSLNTQPRLVALRTTVSPEQNVQTFMRQIANSIEHAAVNDAQGEFRIAFRFSSAGSTEDRPFAFANELAGCDVFLDAKED